jgi:hypothetical protein
LMASYIPLDNGVVARANETAAPAVVNPLDEYPFRAAKILDWVTMGNDMCVCVRVLIALNPHLFSGVLALFQTALMIAVALYSRWHRQKRLLEADSHHHRKSLAASSTHDVSKGMAGLGHK